MPPTLDYRDWVVILPRSTAAPDATGEAVESWPDPPADPTQHAARVEQPTGAYTADSPRHSTDRIRLRFRCLVPIGDRDRVQLVDTQAVFSVVGAWRERAAEGRGYQTVCELLGPTAWLR